MTSIQRIRAHRGGSFQVRPGLFLGIALALASPAGAAVAECGSRGLLADSLQAILSGDVSRARWGVLAVSLDRGDTLLAWEETRRLIPASNVKLFTTGAYLKRFGSAPGPPTEILARGRVRASRRDGVAAYRLKGALLLRGGGTPDIVPLAAPGSRGLLDSLALLLHASGLRKFEGTLWVDATLFAPEPFGPGWAIDDLPWSYGAPLNAILANGNAATLIATAEGSRVALRLEPAETPLRVVGSVSVSDSGAAPRLSLSREPGSRLVRVAGSLPPGGSARRQIAVPDPDSAAGLVLLGAMRRAGIEVKAGVRMVEPELGLADWTATGEGWTGAGDSGARVVLTLSPPGAAAIVAAVNAFSLNTEAEALLRALDPAPRGKTAAGALRALRGILAGSGVDTLDLSLVDGSGLSPMNLATPKALVAWLSHLDRDSTLAAPFRAALPAPGSAGTLERRMNGLADRSAVSAKSGTLTNVSALSGYVQTRDGERVVFAIVSNANRGAAAARAAEERIVALLAGHQRPATRPTAAVGIPR